MKILIIHPSYAGQFIYLAAYLGRNPENDVVFLAKTNSMGVKIAGVRLALYKAPQPVDNEHTHHYLRTATEAVLEGQQTVRALDGLRHQGFVPDVIIGHSGWGSLMYCKDIYPEVPVLGYFEWYYLSEHSDSYWWPDEKPEIDAKLSIRTKNMHHLLSLEACDLRMTPTRWQQSRFPEIWQPHIHVQHDGIDTVFCCPPPDGRHPGLDLVYHPAAVAGDEKSDKSEESLAGTDKKSVAKDETEQEKAAVDETRELHIDKDTPIITYVSRGFEGMRGFPEFMEAIRLVLAQRKDVHVVCVGTDRVCYGAHLKDSTYLKEEEKRGFDHERVHFVGSLNRGDFKRVMQSSWCHVYLTRPFILSWSMLEAMSFGCPLVASKTPPCEEFVEDRTNGLLAEFRSPHHIARRILELLEDRALAERLGKAARETVLSRVELNACLRREEDMIFSLLK